MLKLCGRLGPAVALVCRSAPRITCSSRQLCVCVFVCVCVALETKTQNNNESQKILPPLKSKNKKNETGSTQQQRFEGQLLHSFLSQFMSVFQHALQLRASMRSAVAQHLHPVSHSTLLLLLMTTFQELCKCPHRALPLPHVCATVVP